MDRMLLNSTSRRLKLLELLNSSSQWVLVNYVAKELGCSPQTVISDCEHIENEWPDYLTIDFSKKRGLRFQMVKNHPISDLYKEIMKEALTFALMEAAFFNPGMNSAFYHQKLFISDSSLYRVFRSLKPLLQERGIDFAQTSYTMTGSNELQVRYFLILYFLEVNKISDWPFPLDKKQLMKTIEIVKSIYEFKMNVSFSNYLLYAMAITIIREQQGFKIRPSIINKHLNVNPIEPSENLDLFLQENFPEVDKNSFYLSIFWWNYSWNNAQEKQNVRQYAEQFMSLLSDSIGIKPSAESNEAIVTWMMHIYARHQFYPYEKFILYDHYHYATVSVKRTYTFYTQKVAECLDQIEKKSRFPWKTTYLNEMLHKILLLWANLLDSLEQLQPKISVVILSNIGIEHSDILSYLLQKDFKKKLLFAFQEMN
ncbi:helix-turn-helix domain-containing protein [Enterococcus rivorum]|uniref:helix-turn-helix domain-containing protein n=1 Tax=Enterococcus rivorum TaxID=762845 RepID=UPI003629E89C